MLSLREKNEKPQKHKKNYTRLQKGAIMRAKWKKMISQRFKKKQTFSKWETWLSQTDDKDDEKQHDCREKDEDTKSSDLTPTYIKWKIFFTLMQK